MTSRALGRPTSTGAAGGPNAAVGMARDEQEPREPERGRERPDREVAARTARVRTHGPRLHHDQAAVDGEDLSGDERRLVRHEEGDGGGDLLGRAETVQRRAGA